MAMKNKGFYSGVALLLALAAALLSSCSETPDTIIFTGSLNGYLDACG